EHVKQKEEDDDGPQAEVPTDGERVDRLVLLELLDVAVCQVLGERLGILHLGQVEVSVYFLAVLVDGPLVLGRVGGVVFVRAVVAGRVLRPESARDREQGQTRQQRQFPRQRTHENSPSTRELEASRRAWAVRPMIVRTLMGLTP